MTYTVTVYKSGNSKVITIPAKLGIEVGDQFELIEQKNIIQMKKKRVTKTSPTKVAKKKQIIQKQVQAIRDFKGSTPGLVGDMTAAEIDDFLEGIYE